ARREEHRQRIRRRAGRHWSERGCVEVRGLAQNGRGTDYCSEITKTHRKGAKAQRREEQLGKNQFCSLRLCVFAVKNHTTSIFVNECQPSAERSLIANKTRGFCDYGST